jgi:hypothetical protein
MTGRSGEHVTRAIPQPLPVLEQPQFFTRTDEHVRIRANRVTATSALKAGGGEHTIAEIGLSDRA